QRASNRSRLREKYTHPSISWHCCAPKWMLASMRRTFSASRIARLTGWNTLGCWICRKTSAAKPYTAWLVAPRTVGIIERMSRLQSPSLHLLANNDLAEIGRIAAVIDKFCAERGLGDETA